MQTIFAAVRKSIDDGHEWIDTGTSSFNLDLCRQQIKKSDDFIPYFAKDNPVIRVSQFELKETFVIERFTK